MCKATPRRTTPCEKKFWKHKAEKLSMEHIMNHYTIIATAGTALAAPSFMAPLSIASPSNSAGVAAADFDGDGILNFFDVSAYLSAFSAGCP
jgi:hypothetical protein